MLAKDKGNQAQQNETKRHEEIMKAMIAILHTARVHANFRFSEMTGNHNGYTDTFHEFGEITHEQVIILQ